MIGASYYPNFHPREEWATDLARMKEHGFDLFRTAEHKCDWEQMEPEPGAYRFDWLDEIMDLAQENELGVLLGTGTTNPPIWLLEENPDLLIQSREGLQYTNTALWNWACPDHPELIPAADRFLTVYLKRYRDHPALFAWQLHNELGYPWREKISGEVDVYCYCSYTQKEFRNWLKNRYKDLDTLNEHWQWSPTNPCYTDWDQIQAPRRQPYEWVSTAMWVDWRRFCQENIADYLRWHQEKVKSIDPHHPTMTNTFLFVNKDPLGSISAIDPWLFSEHCDALGFDLYPGVENKMFERPEFASMFLAIGYCAAKHNGKDFWVPEIQSGPIGGWFSGPHNEGDPRDIARLAVDSLAHGSKVNIYLGWRERRPLSLRWDSLCNFDGKPTERLREVSKVVKTFQNNRTLLMDAEPELSQIGILYDVRSGIVARGLNEDALVHDAIVGLYRSLWELHFSADFIRADLLKPQQLKQYRLLFMPAAVCISAKILPAIREFVEKGGCFVTSANCGFLDENGWRNPIIPGGGLDELIGIKQKTLKVTETTEIKLDVGTGRRSLLRGALHREEFEISSDVVILGKYTDTHTPAIINRNIGMGSIIHFGTHIDIAYCRYGHEENKQFYSELAEKIGITRNVVLETKAEPGLIDLHLLRNPQGRIIVITSISNEDALITLKLSKNQSGEWTNLVNGKAVSFYLNEEGHYEVAVKVPARGYLLLAQSK